MIKRIAIAIGSIAAAAVLALGLAAAGFGPVTTNADQADAQGLTDAGIATDPRSADPAVQVQTETIYIRPAARPKVIHVTRTVPANASQKTGKAANARARDEDDDEHGEHERAHERREHEDD